jgi:osmotically-inducible protein OsmY
MTRLLSTRQRVIVAALAATTLLGACAPLVLGGAMVGGTLVATDRRTTGIQLEDQTIELKAANRVREVLGDRGRVSITSFNRIALITGEVASEADKTSAEQAVAKVENLRSVVNELSIQEPSGFTTRSNDLILAGKVKASFVDAKDLLANAFKVVADRGAIYLMGRVTEREANRATEIARAVPGVMKVVKVFEIVTEDELADKTQRPLPNK